VTGVLDTTIGADGGGGDGVDGDAADARKYAALHAWTRAIGDASTSMLQPQW
jgi:hypothetical protein